MRAHDHRFRVIFGDTDKMGVVYYAHYFRYFEMGRNELLRAADYPYTQLESEGYQLPVVRASAKYHHGACYDDELVLTTRVSSVRFTTAEMEYRLMRPEDDTLIATGQTTHACIDANGKLVRLPASLREVLVG